MRSCQPPFSTGGLVDGGALSPGPFYGIVFSIPAQMPIQKVLISLDEEGAGPTGRIENTQIADVARRECPGFLRPGAANAETIVRGLGRPAYPDGVLVDHIFISLGVTAGIVRVPSQRLEEGIDKLPPEWCFKIVAGAICLPILFETGDQFKN